MIHLNEDNDDNDDWHDPLGDNDDDTQVRSMGPPLKVAQTRLALRLKSLFVASSDSYLDFFRSLLGNISKIENDLLPDFPWQLLTNLNLPYNWLLTTIDIHSY